MTYSINSGNDIPGVVSGWQRLKRRDELDGTATFTDIAINTWRIPLMSVTNFEAYRALQGTLLSTIETNDIDDRDAFTSYNNPIMSLISGRQDGINMRDVAISFEVDVS